MPTYERGPVRIHYEEKGSGFPLLILPGGGLNSTIAGLATTHPFSALEEFKDRYRCIVADLRNSPPGQSSGPLEVDRPWDSYADDQIGLLDHLGVKKFMVLGYCIGQPFIWNLIKRVGDRIVAAVLAQPSGHRETLPTQFYDRNVEGWAPALMKKHPEITMDQAKAFLKKMYLENPDFVFTVPRDFVKNCHTPILVLPDDSPPHPYKVAMEVVMLSPNSQVSLYPWKDAKEKIPLAVRHVRTFLRANDPTVAAGQSQFATAADD
jgi:pimeloyl-ACP methyl ester carboxylesterase